MMMKRVLACAGLAIACLAQVAIALPDLAVTQLEISPAVPTDGALVTLIATIENVGLSDADDPFFVRFEADGQEIALFPFTSLRSRRSKRVTTTWKATAGPHTLSVEVDGSHSQIGEADDLNNTQTLLVNVRLRDDVLATLAPLRIAVARFSDISGSGFVNAGEGVADALIDRLTASGLRILDRTELDAVMQANGLNPARLSDVALAGRLIGADLLILGSVVGISVQQTSLSLGFLRVDSASVNVTLSAQIIDVYNAHTLSTETGEGQGEGTTGFSIDIGDLFSFLTSGSTEVCDGGLQTDRAWYNPSHTVLLGYRNDGVAAWFGIEIYASTGAFLKWLGWQFVDTDECAQWFWDQRDVSGFAMNPGIYTAKLWDGSSYVDTVGFQIRPGISLSVPAVDEITVGSPQFDGTVVGMALNQAIDRLTSKLFFSLESVTPVVLSRDAPATTTGTAAAYPEGQIAAILPDGRIAINLGTLSGVREGDVFEVLEVESLILDPQTNEVLAYNVVSVKGEIVVTEAREQVSYAVPTSSFVPIIGDVVRGRR